MVRRGHGVRERGVGGVAGLVVVGMMCYVAWLNELGAKSVVLRTQDVDLARRRRLKLEAPLGFLDAMQATKLPFAAVPVCRAASRRRRSSCLEPKACASPLAQSANDAPTALRLAARRRLPAMRKILDAHPMVLEQIEAGLA